MPVMDTTKWKQILVPIELKDRLDNLKIHIRQPYHEVIDKYLPDDKVIKDIKNPGEDE